MDPRLKAEKEAKEKKRKELLDRAFDRVIGSQLEKFSAASKKVNLAEDEAAYRQSLELEREKASKKRRKDMSIEHEQLSRETGLNQQVIALMTADGVEETEDCNDVNSRSKRKRKESKRKKKKSEKKKHKRKKSVSRKSERKSYKKRKKHLYDEDSNSSVSSRWSSSDDSSEDRALKKKNFKSDSKR